ncbi:hypothetical protein PWT90_09398 [Aphanocladium album]|nr:hypothetical protein PWT90_09398 [Aphanocladium album]
MKANISLPSSRQLAAKSHGLIYFIPGNPGVVEFYTDFLRSLRALLDKTEGDTAYDIYGRNLLGFRDADHQPFSSKNLPFGLDSQVEGMWADIASQGYGNNNDKPYDSVILIGHSIGAYIVVETFHRHSLNPKVGLNLQHGFLLFPTISYIARSPNGLKVTALQQSRYLPGVEENLHHIAKALLFFVPQSILQWVWANFLGFSGGAASTLAEWLKSRDGVWQAIHLGRSELKYVVKDKWDETFWDAVATAGNNGVAPKFFFFYGKHDHWVDDTLRDEFISRQKARGHGPGRPSLEVDTGDIGHAFCIKEDAYKEKLPLVKKIATKFEESKKQRKPRQFTGWQLALFFCLSLPELQQIAVFPERICSLGKRAENFATLFTHGSTVAGETSHLPTKVSSTVRKMATKRDRSQCVVTGTMYKLTCARIVPLEVTRADEATFNSIARVGKLAFGSRSWSWFLKCIDILREKGDQEWNLLTLSRDLSGLFGQGLVGFKPVCIAKDRSAPTTKYLATFSVHFFGQNCLDSNERVVPDDGAAHRMLSQVWAYDPDSSIGDSRNCRIYEGKLIQIPFENRALAHGMLMMLSLRWLAGSMWRLAGAIGISSGKPEGGKSVISPDNIPGNVADNGIRSSATDVADLPPELEYLPVKIRLTTWKRLHKTANSCFPKSKLQANVYLPVEKSR